MVASHTAIATFLVQHSQVRPGPSLAAERQLSHTIDDPDPWYISFVVEDLLKVSKVATLSREKPRWA